LLFHKLPAGKYPALFVLLLGSRNPVVDDFLQFADGKRFLQVVVHSGSEAIFPTFRKGVSGKGHNGCLAATAFRFQESEPPGCLKAVQNRHLAVHQDQIKSLVECELQGQFSILRRGDLKPEKFQDFPGKFPDYLVVFRDENALLFGLGFGRGEIFVVLIMRHFFRSSHCFETACG